MQPWLCALQRWVVKISILLQFQAMDMHDSMKGCTNRCKIVKLLQFRAIDTDDSTKGLHPTPQDRNFTTVSGDRDARSYERVAPRTTKCWFSYNFARSTHHAYLVKGCSANNKMSILLQFRAIVTHDLTKRVAFPQAFSGPPPINYVKY